MNVVFGFKEFTFLLTGLKWTVLLSLIAFAGGGIMGLLVAVARTVQRCAGQ
jgi:polar amino acid transport system permease protein